MNKEEIAIRLREYNENTNYSLREIAEITDTDIKTVELYHSGKTEPSIDFLIKLSELYNVNIDTLLGKYQTDNLKSKTNKALYAISILSFFVLFIPAIFFNELNIIAAFDYAERYLLIASVLIISLSLSQVVIYHLYMYKNEFNKEYDFRRLLLIINGLMLMLTMFLVIIYQEKSVYMIITNSILVIISVVFNAVRYSRSRTMFERSRTLADNRRIISIISAFMALGFGGFLLIFIEVSDFIYVTICGGILVAYAIYTLLFGKTHLNSRRQAIILMIIPGVVLVYLWTHALIEDPDITLEIALMILLSTTLLSSPALLINYDLLEKKLESGSDNNE